MNFQQTPWKHDPLSKRFSHQQFFGAASLASLPPTLPRGLKWVLDQRNSLRCTGYAGAADGSHIHGRKFSGDWQAAKIGKIQNKSVDVNGGDPNAAMKSERDFGFLLQENAPYSIETHGIEGSGMDVWPAELDTLAMQFDNIPGFVRVDGPYDTFDNIRNALFMAFDMKTGLGPTVRAFGRWYHDWTNTPGGIIPTTTNHFAGYHAYIFINWVTIDGVQYLVAQNSYGTTAGAMGLHYFSREVINREFDQWGTSLKIVKTLTQAQLDEAKKQTPLGALWRSFIDLLYIVSEKFGLYGGSTPQHFMLELIRILTAFRDSLQKPQNAPQTHPKPDPVVAPKPVAKDRLHAFCKAIEAFEGYAPGSRSYRNNNPGNCRYSRVGYLPIYGKVREDRKGVKFGQQGFAIFETKELGELYMQNLVKTKIKAHPNWTIYEFIADPKDGWAPAIDDNQPDIYSKFIAKKLGVPVETQIKELLA